MNDNEEPVVMIITGRVWKTKGGDSEGVHVMLMAPDDDTAVRTALEALAKEVLNQPAEVIGLMKKVMGE